MRPKFLIVGSNGFLGSTLLKEFKTRGIEVRGVNSTEFDLAGEVKPQALAILKNENFTHIIITAAISDVEKCYSDQLKSRRVNVTGTIDLLSLLKQFKITPIFFSSDYVFGLGKGFYLEDSPKHPETIYGHQKLEVETYIENQFESYLILRTSNLVSSTPHSRNFLSTALKDLAQGKVVPAFEDQWMNPTFIQDVGALILGLIEKKASGAFHLGGEKSHSRYEILKSLAEKFGYDSNLVQPVKMRDRYFSEPRPTHKTLDSSKIRRLLGFKFKETEGISERDPLI